MTDWLIEVWQIVTLNMKHNSGMLVKVLSHPGHGKPRCCIAVDWTCFSLLKMSLIQEASLLSRNWKRCRVLHSMWKCSCRVWKSTNIVWECPYRVVKDTCERSVSELLVGSTVKLSCFVLCLYCDGAQVFTNAFTMKEPECSCCENVRDSEIQIQLPFVFIVTLLVYWICLEIWWNEI